MQQDPSTWNKHLYRTATSSPASTPSTPASSTTGPPRPSTALTATNSSSSSSSASLPSTPCLTSSYVRPNTNPNPPLPIILPFKFTPPSTSSSSSSSSSVTSLPSLPFQPYSPSAKAANLGSEVDPSQDVAHPGHTPTLDSTLSSTTARTTTAATSDSIPSAHNSDRNGVSASEVGHAADPVQTPLLQPTTTVARLPTVHPPSASPSPSSSSSSPSSSPLLSTLAGKGTGAASGTSISKNATIATTSPGSSATVSSLSDSSPPVIHSNKDKEIKDSKAHKTNKVKRKRDGHVGREHRSKSKGRRIHADHLTKANSRKNALILCSGSSMPSPGDIHSLSSPFCSPGTASSSSAPASVAAASFATSSSSSSSSTSPSSPSSSSSSTPLLSPTHSPDPSIQSHHRSLSHSSSSNLSLTLQEQDSFLSSPLPPITTDRPVVPTLHSEDSNHPLRNHHHLDHFDRPTYFFPHFFTERRSYRAQPSLDQQAPPACQDTPPEPEPESRIKGRRSHTVVTDIKSINFRDISTVPTLTTFGRKRTKRRNSSLSHPQSPTPPYSSALDLGLLPSRGSSSSSSSSSRRKKAKNLSASLTHGGVPWNLCTASCGCSHSLKPLEKDPDSALDEATLQAVSQTIEGGARQPMESTGRIRTISGSDIQVSDPSSTLSASTSHRKAISRPSAKASHRPDHHHHHRQALPQHPHQQQQQDQSLGTHPLQLHPLQEQGHCLPSTQDHRRGQKDCSQHIEAIDNRRRQRDTQQHPYPPHKRQRSPQSMPLESSAPTPSTVNNLERSKRARRLTSGSHVDETATMEGQVENMTVAQEKPWHDTNEKSQPARGNQRLSVLNELTNVAYHTEDPSPETSVKEAIGRQQWAPAAGARSSHHRKESGPSELNLGMCAKEERLSSITSPSAAPSAAQTLIPASIHPLDVEISAQQGTRDEDKGVSANSTLDQWHGAHTQSPVTSSQPSLQTTLESSLPPSHRQPEHRPPPDLQLSKSSVPHSTQGPSVNRPIKVPLQRTSHGIPGPTPLSRAFSSQPIVPTPVVLTLPITRDTLRELDLFEIFKNPQLRHDIVFDPHLQFRPNFDGERGLIKRREADRFWREVESELNTRRAAIATRREAAATMLSLAGLSSHSHGKLVQQQQHQTCPLPKANLLPRLIDELREILLSLLPSVPASASGSHSESNKHSQGASQQPSVNPERSLLSSTLDPDLLLQELDHGVLDVYSLFRFLGDSLKGHCAPMRDSLVESMVSIVIESDEIVRGIRMCFEILEWMKLDIANHQLRTLRPWLLDNSIDFEQKYFTEHLARGGTIQRTREWFKTSWIQWEGVKQSILGKPTMPLVGPSRRLSLAQAVSPSTSTPIGSEGTSRPPMSPPLLAMSGRRRSSIAFAEVGENIMDGVVNEGLLDMILRPHSSIGTMPETFELDHYRLLSFHNDFQDLTILCILLIFFRQLAQNCWTLQDLIDIKKVVWLLLTDENAHFGANTNSAQGAAATGTAPSLPNSGKESTQGYSSTSNGMKDIVIQIEFAARRAKERSRNAGSRRPSLAHEHSPAQASPRAHQASTGSSFGNTKGATLATGPVPASASALGSGLSARETNLLTAWLDNALCRTSTLYTLIQKRLLIHFRRWLYLHSCSSMLVLSSSCASLASVISMSSGLQADSEQGSTVVDQPGNAGITAQDSKESLSKEVSKDRSSHTEEGGHVPEMSPEEANKAATEVLAAKLSFNAVELEAHGLIGLEDEMTTLLEKIRAVTEFNKKVYGTWYRDLVKQGRAESWCDPKMGPSTDS